MYYIVETSKSFNQASTDVESAVVINGFGVMHVHNLRAIFQSKGVAFNEECKIFEVCNAQQAAKILLIDMRLSMALPCRISVYTEKGKTMIGLIKPVQMLAALSQNPALAKIATEVEEKALKIIDDAR